MLKDASFTIQSIALHLMPLQTGSLLSNPWRLLLLAFQGGR
jgi:hypothetical protein